MKKQVAKSQIFTKESLTRIQDKMRNCCIKSFNKVYEQDYQLKTKEKGRNQDIPVSQMQNYNKVKKQYEKNKKLLEQANKKTDLVNENGNNIKEIVSNLKPNLVNKKNYTISQEQVTTIKDYISDVEDTTKSMKKVNDLDVIIKEYEKDLKEHNNEVRELNSTIRQKDEEIRDLTQNLDIAKNTISKQQKEINVLKPFKYLWNKLIKFIKNKVRYSKNGIYKKVYAELKSDNILRQADIDFIDNKNTKKRNYEL